MAIEINKSLVKNSIIIAYDILKQLGYEKDVTILEYSFNGTISKIFITKGIQISHDTVSLSKDLKLLTSDSPSVYIKCENLHDGTTFLTPKFTQIFYKVELTNIDELEPFDTPFVKSKEYSVHSINRVFNLQFIKLKL